MRGIVVDGPALAGRAAQRPVVAEGAAAEQKVATVVAVCAVDRLSSKTISAPW